MKVIRTLLLAAVIVMVIGLPSQPDSNVKAGGGMCPLIDVYVYAPAGEGNGGDFYGFLKAGTVVEYYIDYEGTGAGAGIDVYSGGFPDPWVPGDVYSAGGEPPFSGSFTIPADGNYAIGTGSGGPDSSGGMVRVLVEYDCGLSDTMCTVIGSANGKAMETGFEIEIKQGTYVTAVAQRDNDDCWIEFGIHGPGGFAHDPIGGNGGSGMASDVVIIPETGLYGFGIGPTDDVSECLNGTATITAYVGCSPAEVVAVSAPGCDARINLPSTAVVGTFVADASLYWKPDQLTEPTLTINAGQSAWVLGKDESGGYYKILWSCDFLWVPASTVGPDYDDVWNGTPLPQGVVG